MAMKTAHVLSIALLLSFGAAHSMGTTKAVALRAHSGLQTGAGHATRAVRATVEAPVGFVFGDKVGADAATTVVAVVAAVATYKSAGYLARQAARLPYVGALVSTPCPYFGESVVSALNKSIFSAQVATTETRLAALEANKTTVEENITGLETAVAELKEFRTAQQQANEAVAEALAALKATSHTHESAA